MMHYLRLVELANGGLQIQETDADGALVALHDPDGEGDTSPFRHGNTTWRVVGNYVAKHDPSGDIWDAFDAVREDARQRGYDVPDYVL